MSLKQRSSAWPLALLYAGLVVYASLYPFVGWRLQGVAPTAFLFAPFPQYWTGFDLLANFVGYVPLGFLLALALLRSGWAARTWPVALALPVLLSLGVETLQNHLPVRIPSNVDFLLNSAGGWIGAATAWILMRLGALRRWSQFRADWFVPQAHGSLVLLALWPLALLYPLSVPFGLGQVVDRLHAGLAAWLLGTPFLAWLPARAAVAAPLDLWVEAVCIAMALLAPLLMGFADVRGVARRLAFFVLFFACALAAVGLSSALTYGPSHAWAWVGPPAARGLGLAGLLGLILIGLPGRWAIALAIGCLVVSLALLNQAPASPYFAQSLEVWEQGKFIRFHGLSQWLGWLWPYAALLVALRALVSTAPRGQ